MMEKRFDEHEDIVDIGPDRGPLSASGADEAEEPVDRDQEAFTGPAAQDADVTFTHPSGPDQSGTKKRKKGGNGSFAGVLVGMVLMLGLGIVLGRMSVFRFAVKNNRYDNQAILDKMERLESFIDSYYLDEVDKEKLADGVYRGLVYGLGDPYSAYYSEQDYQDMQEEDNGEYRGIGIVVYKDAAGHVVIESVMKNQPAYNAGVEAGDYLVAVDDKSTEELTLSETVKLIKKGEGDTVKIKLLRGNETLEKVVDKADIVVESVTGEMKEDGIGYISISQFIKNTDEQFISVLDDLESQGLKGLVIDLRDNGGGLVDSSVNIVSRMIPQGDLVTYIEDKNGKRETYLSNNPKTLDIPTIILVNGNTASASEIMTGCLKDYGRVTVLGSKTFGKGIVQYVMPVGDGSAIELTVANYYTPNGTNIHKKGIEPDVKMEYTSEEWSKIKKDPSKDTQLKKAISLLKNK